MTFWAVSHTRKTPLLPPGSGLFSRRLKPTGPVERDYSAGAFYKTPGNGVKPIRVAYVLEVPERKNVPDVQERGCAAHPGKTE